MIHYNSIFLQSISNTYTDALNETSWILVFVSTKNAQALAKNNFTSKMTVHLNLDCAIMTVVNLNCCFNNRIARFIRESTSSYTCSVGQSGRTPMI
ncbi:hypothetical protein L596_009997 [Steinernema carpocapsae]|uniref:Uncharacterized protein n=1 Tax=Steinernema carpocapsae TaxID=34508 RepID=A0A4U5PGZ2_STECR|nr:hypothetical protein L596_009997 [Steinernema carpocapsae]